MNRFCQGAPAEDGSPGQHYGAAFGDLPDARPEAVGEYHVEMSRSTVPVVEGERKIRDPVRGYVELEGFGVLTTESGAQGVACGVRRPRPDATCEQRVCEGAVA